MGSCLSSEADNKPPQKPNQANNATKPASAPPPKPSTAPAQTTPKPAAAPSQNGGKPAPPPPAAAPAPKKTKRTQRILAEEVTHTNDINDDYTFNKELGSGNFGTTRIAVSKKDGQEYACKIVSKAKLVHEEDREDMRREVQLLKHLNGNKHIVHFIAAYEDRNYVYVVMNMCRGGELFDAIINRGSYTEKDAAKVIRQTLRVVAHCHDMGVIHRDLKPENFLLDTPSSDATIVATDFGLGVFFHPGQYFTDLVGSPYYVAPEVLENHYNEKADVWSCGVILYILLCGLPPFNGESDDQIYASIRRGKFDLESAPWPNVSLQAKDAIRQMLTKDVRKRPSAADMLKHPWIIEDGVAPDAHLGDGVIGRLKNFSGNNKLKKKALQIIGKNLKPADIVGLKNLFEAIDADGNGVITIDELRTAVKEKGVNFTEEQIIDLMESADVDGSGTIDYSEFVAATMHRSRLEQDEVLWKAFQELDKDGSGALDAEEVLEALKSLGVMDVEQAKEIIKEVDKDGNGLIDFEEFSAMLREQDEKKFDVITKRRSTRTSSH